MWIVCVCGRCIWYKSVMTCSHSCNTCQSVKSWFTGIMLVELNIELSHSHTFSTLCALSVFPISTPEPLVLLTPPRCLTANRTQQGVLLSWIPPANHTAPIQHYVMEFRLGERWEVLDDSIPAGETDLLARDLIQVKDRTRTVDFTHGIIQDQFQDKGTSGT